MAQAISQQRSGCSAVERTRPCGHEHTGIEFERCLKKISFTPMRRGREEKLKRNSNAGLKKEIKMVNMYIKKCRACW